MACPFRLPNNPRSNGIRTLPEAQATTSTWIPPVGPLGELTALSEVAVRRGRDSLRELEKAAAASPLPPSFSAALRGVDVRVIAELKRRSPSKGDLNLTMDLGARAVDYTAGGAVALSVLTEPTRFGGSLQDLETVCRAVTVPLLRKDFIVDVLQLLQARLPSYSLPAPCIRIDLPRLRPRRRRWRLTCCSRCGAKRSWSARCVYLMV